MILRQKRPERSNPARENRYQSYKMQLRSDFNSCCGYCDDDDENFGLITGYHIDHFAPRKWFPELETEYKNLVYSCPICNIAKSAKWNGKVAHPSHDGQRGFIDPCLSDYDDHLCRDETGRIRGKTELGRYIVSELKLSLLRHRLNWQIRTLEQKIFRLGELAEQLNNGDPDLNAVKDILVVLIGHLRDSKNARRDH